MKYNVFFDWGKKQEIEEEYEDNFWIDLSIPVFATADGLGGRLGGRKASGLVMTLSAPGLKRLSKKAKDFSYFKDGVTELMADVNQELREYGQTNPEYKGLGSTLDLVLPIENYFYTVHIGDGRIYGINRDKKIVQLTEDQTLIQHLIRQGRRISEIESKTSPDRDDILSYLGVDQENLVVDVDRFSASEYKLLLMTTDGLINSSLNERIEYIMTKRRFGISTKQKLNGIANDLVHAGNNPQEEILNEWYQLEKDTRGYDLEASKRKHSGEDNITGILIKL